MPVWSVFPDKSIAIRRKRNTAANLFKFIPLFHHGSAKISSKRELNGGLVPNLRDSSRLFITNTIKFPELDSKRR